MNDNNLTGAGVSSLTKFHDIRYLSLSANSLDDESIKKIKYINPKGLIYMRLSKNRFTNKALEEFLSMNDLEVLLMDRNKLTKKKA